MNERIVPTILSYEVPRARRSLFVRICLVLHRQRNNAALAMASAFLVGLSILASILPRSPHQQVLSVYALLTSAALIGVSIRGRDGAVRYARAPRWATGLVAAVCLIGWMPICYCPHAVYLGIGPLKITLWGDACGNPQPIPQFWPLHR